MTDIIVIGGGIAGLSVAARLSEDAKVVVLEAESAPGYHASGRSAALIEQNYGAPSVQALNRSSVAYLEHHDGGFLSPRGLLLVASSEDEDAFRADLSSLALQEISIETARSMIPIVDPEKARFSGYHPDAQDIDTDRLLQNFLRQLRRNGGQLLTNQRVCHIERLDSVWHTKTGSGAFKAPLLVNAAGAWADQIAAMAGIPGLLIVPYRRSMARIAAPAGHDLASWPLLFGVGESWYAKPDAGCLLVSPADEDPVEPHDAWAEDLTLAEGLARYEAMVSTPVTRPLASWAGLRSFAPDRTLVLGPDPNEPAFIWCAGQGGYGFQTAPAASQLVADLVTDRQSVLPSSVIAELKPDRLR